jgi:hypothetical protein
MDDGDFALIMKDFIEKMTIRQTTLVEEMATRKTSLEKQMDPYMLS